MIPKERTAMNYLDRDGELVWDQQPPHLMHLTSDAEIAAAGSTAAVATSRGHSHGGGGGDNIGAVDEGNDIFDDGIFDDLDHIISITDEDESTSESYEQYFHVLQQQQYKGAEDHHHHRHGGARFLNKSNYTNHTKLDLLGGSDVDCQLAATTTTFFQDPDYNRIDGQQLEVHPSSSTGQHPDPVLSMASFFPTTSSSSSSSYSSNITSSMLGRKVSFSNSRIENGGTNVQNPSSFHPCLLSSSDEISSHMQLYHPDAMLRLHHQEEGKEEEKEEEERVGQPFGGSNVPSIGDRPSSSQNDIQSSQIDVAAVPSSLVNSFRKAGDDGDNSRNTVNASHDSWNERFLELCQFVRENGHTCVPHMYAPNPRLAQWVKRQRHYYQRKHSHSATKINSKSSSGAVSPVSSLTDERESALNRLNFCWNSHEELWNQRFMELQKYKEKFGHCSVPIHYADNKQLAVWTKTQRRQYKCYITGRKSKITPERIERLNAIGFCWNPRNL